MVNRQYLPARLQRDEIFPGYRYWYILLPFMRYEIDHLASQVFEKW